MKSSFKTKTKLMSIILMVFLVLPQTIPVNIHNLRNTHVETAQAATATKKSPSVTITDKKEILSIGATYTFKGKAINVKKPSLQWTSSNPSIASIGKTDGVVKAKSSGTTVITLKDATSGKKEQVFVKVLNKYTPPKGSDKATFVSGLDLSKKKGTYYKTTKDEYIKTTRFILYLPKGTEVPVKVISLINYMMDSIEDMTGYKFYAQQYAGRDTFYLHIDEIYKYFTKADTMIKAGEKHDRVNIIVTNNPDGVDAYSLGSDGILISPRYLKLLDGEGYAMIHELLHLAWLRNGCNTGRVLCEGFATYFATKIIEQDTKLNSTYNGYEEFKDYAHAIDEASMEDSFILMKIGQSNYKLGFRMTAFIIEEYGIKEYRRVHDKLSMEYPEFENPPLEAVAKVLKNELSKDFFKAFARWHGKNLERFGDMDLSEIGDWRIEYDYLLRHYYGKDKHVVVLETVINIQPEAFYGNKTMETIELPPALDTIAAAAFYQCEKLKEVLLPDTVTTIAMNAFENCYSLKKITIPEGVNYIASNAFAGCKDLTIYGKKGSYAETYAKDNKISFKIMN